MNPELHNSISSFRIIEETGEVDKITVKTKIEDSTIDRLSRSFKRKQRNLGCHTAVFA